MKKYLFLFSVSTLFSLGVIAQCNPGDHDWGKAVYGVYPNPEQGETFAEGNLNAPYTDVVYVLVPTNAGAFNPAFSAFVIDSLSLDGISVQISGTYVPLSNLGLQLTCNNLGHSENPCVFLSGNAYCGDISGFPNQAGTFPLRINVTIYGDFGFVTSFPYTYEGYSLVIHDPDGIGESGTESFGLSQNSPNPAVGFTNITFDLPAYSEINFTVLDLIGEKIYSRNMQGKRGFNTFRFDTSEIENGVYLYSISSGEKKFTRRMIVQH